MGHPEPPTEAVEEMLPLKAVDFSILLALTEEDSYGYGLVRRVAEESAGAVRLSPGNLYQVLDRMIAAGLVQESDRRPGPDGDSRRRYYAITDLGREVAAAEARRLAAVMDTAEKLALLSGGGER